MSAPLLDATLAGDDIRDIRGPVAVPEPLPWLLLLTLALLVVALAAGVARLLRYLRNRRPTPYQLAKLHLFEAAERADSESADLLAEQVSSAVRHYVEARFAIRAAHRTTEEFLSELLASADTQLSSYREELSRFLGTCDIAKFAGRNLPGELRRELCSDAMRFVDAAEMALLRGD